MSSSFCIQFFKPLLWALTTAILGISEHMAFESKSKSSGGAGSSTDTPQWCMDICLTASQKTQWILLDRHHTRLLLFSK